MLIVAALKYRDSLECTLSPHWSTGTVWNAHCRRSEVQGQFGMHICFVRGGACDSVFFSKIIIFKICLPTDNKFCYSKNTCNICLLLFHLDKIINTQSYCFRKCVYYSLCFTGQTVFKTDATSHKNLQRLELPVRVSETTGIYQRYL